MRRSVIKYRCSVKETLLLAINNWPNRIVDYAYTWEKKLATKTCRSWQMLNYVVFWSINIHLELLPQGCIPLQTCQVAVLPPVVFLTEWVLLLLAWQHQKYSTFLTKNFSLNSQQRLWNTDNKNNWTESKSQRLDDVNLDVYLIHSIVTTKKWWSM